MEMAKKINENDKIPEGEERKREYLYVELV